MAYNGIINIYKEKGYTSHDVVAKLRGILCMKKIGHTGTLDPDAEGVLPVCLGSGTKLCDMLTDHDKTYEAVLLLGRVTDTQDISGAVLKEEEVYVTEEAVKSTILGFIGEYQQIPPMYSAIKVNGKKLYELARKGIEVERQARTVVIREIQILSMNLPKVQISVTCSKGTYIRTLCHDIGEQLGCGGCMESLVRTKVGRFSYKQALTLNQIEQIRDENRLFEYIIPVEQVLEEYPAYTVQEKYVNKLYNGNPLTKSCFIKQEVAKVDKLIRVYDAWDSFIAVYEYREEKNSYFPLKMFRGTEGIKR